MKKDFAAPIIVLAAICLVISLALAVTNSFTEPVIAVNAAERAETARRALIPEAEDFAPIDASGLPGSVTDAYGTTNGVGYVFSVSATGYGGSGSLQILVGLDNDGKIIAVKTLANGETKGIGARVSEPGFEGQFPGKDGSLEGVNAITGATISSTAYLGAVRDAFAAYTLVKEAGQ
ncbi:MAG: FMN-binding protein [Oscillospiraceae bacterium]|jgi:electron transport complex protein RnfG|nr:FMN-binding protein [Oscillospiraceae bacterium]